MADEELILPTDPNEIADWVKGAAFRKAIESVSDEYWELSEVALLNKFKPTTTDILLKNSFWNEVRRAIHFGHLIDPEQVYGGLCSYQHWWHGVLRKSERLAWLLLPIQDIAIPNQVLASTAMERVVEVLALSCVDRESGKIDWAAANFAFQVMGKILYRPDSDR